MASKGYFIITDISGYTEFLTSSELDHANAILQSLFDAQLAAIQHPFILSGFRGDAIFLYVPETNFVQAQSFVEALRQMQYNTNCTCRACKNMATLDLKMCIHYGEYLIQRLGDREELIGADVIVPHRMLKNHVIEQTGVKAYAIFSEAAARALGLPELTRPLIPYAESYEHLGEVRMQVFDLRPVWTSILERQRKSVSKDEAWAYFEIDLPYSPLLIWEYLTASSLEARVLGLDIAERTDQLGGRVGAEATFHCAHGNAHFYARIVDWKPFEYYTFLQRAEPLGNIEYLQTRRLIPLEQGTRLLVTLGKPNTGATEEMRAQFQVMVRIFENVKTVIAQDIAEGRVTATAARPGK